MEKDSVIIIIAIATAIILAGVISYFIFALAPESVCSLNKTNVTVYFFYGEECPHCHNVMPFINSTKEKYPNVDFHILETWHNNSNKAISTSMNQKLGVQNVGVPEVIVVGNDKPLIGDSDIPDKLEGMILEQLENC